MCRPPSLCITSNSGLPLQDLSLPPALFWPNPVPGRPAYLSPLLSRCQALGDPGCPLPTIRRLTPHLSTPAASVSRVTVHSET